MVGWGFSGRRIPSIVCRTMTLLITMPLLASCVACGFLSNTVVNGDKNNAQSTAVTCKAPDFSGPYANEFKNAYEQSKTELGKRILEDCQITDAELNEILDTQNACLAPYGLVTTKSQLTRLRDSALSDDEMNQKNTECAEKTDWWNIEALYDEMQGNPSNLDAEAVQKATYQCLTQHDLLPKPISEQEYLAMELTGSEGLSDEQIAEKTSRWNAFYHVYMQYNDDGSPNSDYDAAKARQFWDCQSDPLAQ